MTIEQRKFSIEHFKDYLRVHNDTIGKLQQQIEKEIVAD
jgi:hypothetical protein